MTSLKEKYKNLEEVLIAFKAELQSLQPRDSESIWWERGLDGVYAHVIDDVKGGGGANQVVAQQIIPDLSYNGYFAIKDVSNSEGFKVAIVDGATWDKNEQSSGMSWCKVNNVSYYVPMVVINVDNKTPYILLHYVASKTTEDGQEQKAYIELICKDSIPDDNEFESYYLIGRVYVSEGKVVITQRHKWGAGNGVPQLWWMTYGCLDE